MAEDREKWQKVMKSPRYFLMASNAGVSYGMATAQSQGAFVKDFIDSVSQAIFISSDRNHEA